MNSNSSADPNAHFESWHLTAYALNELDSDTRQRLEAILANDPALASELAEIQGTLDRLQRELQSSSSATGLDHDRMHVVLNHIRNVSQAESSNETRVASAWYRFRNIGGLAALALAASVLIFFQIQGRPLSSPSTNDLSFATENTPSMSAAPSMSAPDQRFEKSSSMATSVPEVLGELDTADTLSSGKQTDENLWKAEERKKSNESEAIGRDAKVLDASAPEFDSPANTPMVADGLKDPAPILAAESALDAESRALNRNQQDAFSDAIPAAGPESAASGKSLSSNEFGGGANGMAMTPPAPASGGAGGALGYDYQRNGRSEGYALGMQPVSEPARRGRTTERFNIESQGQSQTDSLRRGGIALETINEAVLAKEGSSKGVESPQSKAVELGTSIPDELKANVPSLNRKLSISGDRFDPIPESPFVEAQAQPLSTFSIDVDTASYSKLRQYLIEQNALPSPDAVRIEEMINYFDYAYPGPEGQDPFAAHLTVGICPWDTEHRLVRVAIQAKKIDQESRPASNLVFLIDVSGSMAQANKLPLVKRSLNLLTSQLGENDRVAIVVYAGAAGCVLPSTPGSSKETILNSINELQSGGSTNGGQGIELAYRIAKDNFIAGGINRVILCTDGDFNVGVTGTEQLVTMMKENALSNIFLTCIGYGIGNYNDSMMEQISNQGNGTYGMVDNEMEARRMMIEQLSGTLMTVAKDVKIQIEFNPTRVGAYRLIGYENRRLANRDFDDDAKDAGEIGAGHRVTALYELIPTGAPTRSTPEIDLRYRQPEAPKPATEPAPEIDPARSREWLLLKIRSKQPEGSESVKQEFVLSEGTDASYPGEQLDLDWATSVAEFGLLLRKSQLAQGIDWGRMLARAQECAGTDPYRRECLIMMQKARQLSGR